MMNRVRTAHTRLKDFLVEALAFMFALTAYCFIFGFPEGLAGTLVVGFGCFIGLVMIAAFWGRVSRGTFLVVNILLWGGIGGMVSREAWWPIAIPATVFFVWLMHLHAQDTGQQHLTS